MATRKIALVTGGAGTGIGAGISLALAQQGWSVVVGDRDLDAAERVARDIQGIGTAIPLEIDISSESSVFRAIAWIQREHGPISALVNSAGTGLVKRLADISSAEWDRLHAVDLRGAFLMSRAVIPGMIAAGGGAIVNIGSVQALGPHLGYSAYAAAKAGLVGLTKGIAADYGRDNIRCSIIHPGLVDSPQNREIFAQWGDPDAWISRYLDTRQMIPRLVRPADIGAAAAFLLSPGAASITAAELVVDAGSSAMAFDRDPEEPRQ